MIKLVRFLLLFVSPLALAQGPPAPKGPESPKAAAQIDITGQWVAVVSEDWVYRMVVAPKGDAGSIPISDAGKKAAQEWDPAKDANSCKTYGAAGIIRQPGRIRIAWQDDRTLKMEFDAGTQTRLLHFSTELPPIGYPSSEPPQAFRAPADVGPRSLAGYSVAAWHKQAQTRGLGFGGPPVLPAQRGTLAVLTTNMLPAYLQSNGVPYSDDATLREFYDLVTLPDKTQWLIVTSIVEDPKFLSAPFVTSTQFKREVGAERKWRPTTCT
ncbi:MAG TPA: hypothetical protein VN705_10145 [Steroidobacteraceae bacterium]|nr:hypothetical protein [Steroidobacteraceae bacterium]